MENMDNMNHVDNAENPNPNLNLFDVADANAATPLTWEEFVGFAEAVIRYHYRLPTADAAANLFLAMQDDMEDFFDNLYPETANRQLTNLEEERKSAIARLAQQHVLFSQYLVREREVERLDYPVVDPDRRVYIEATEGVLKRQFPNLCRLFIQEMELEMEAKRELAERQEQLFRNPRW